jgi:hypothetical protein
MIATTPQRSLTRFPVIAVAGHVAFQKMHGGRYMCGLFRPQQEVHVIGGHHVVQDVNRVPEACLPQSPEIIPAIHVETEKETPFLTAMRQVVTARFRQLAPRLSHGNHPTSVSAEIASQAFPLLSPRNHIHETAKNKKTAIKTYCKAI